jgi:hypothetical protein
MASSSTEIDLTSLPKNRAEALASGSLHYYTGKPCRRGHLAMRYASGKQCVLCGNLNSANFAKTPSGRDIRSRYRKTPNGRAVCRASNNGRRAMRNKALPAWEDIDAVREFILNCPLDHHVDHIIPLRGKNICGLHVLSNLQYLPAQENHSKRNRVDPLTLEAAVCVLPQYRSYRDTVPTSGTMD